MIISKTAILFVILSCVGLNIKAQNINDDESKVPEFELPDPLVMSSGQAVTTVHQWRQQRRPELLRLFEEDVYGKVPEKKISVQYRKISTDQKALNGLATQKQVSLRFGQGAKSVEMVVLIYIPNKMNKPVPAFMGLNFNGNHTISNDPEILITTSWVRNNKDAGITDHRATGASRGMSAHRWPVRMILDHGYALVTAYYGDIDPDYDDGFQNGIHPLFYKEGQNRPADDEWGSIGAWAWGLSRILDYLETDPDIDAGRVVLMGHSRLGKTALWAGAQDTRFAVIFSNESGCGGAALSRRRFGETVRQINTSFPHWFCDNFKKYNDREDALPVDQHELIALIAPRPVYITAAEEDRWADPKGMFLACVYAAPVYKLFGLEGFPEHAVFETDHPVSGTIGFHMRPGKHDVTIYDWEQAIRFADRYLK